MPRIAESLDPEDLVDFRGDAGFSSVEDLCNARGDGMVDFMQSLGNIASTHARQRGAKVALRFGEEVVTYGELERHACRVANALLASGIGREHRVAYLGRNSLAYFEFLLGAAKARAVTVPINWRLAVPEVKRLLGDAKPRLILVTAEFAEVAAQAAGDAPVVVIGGPCDSYRHWRDAHPQTEPMLPSSWEDAVLQLYTSGTMGAPRGAVLTNRSLFGLREGIMLESQPDWYRWSPEDVSLIAMPVAHISGSGWGIWTLQYGATGVVTPQFDPHAVFDLMAGHRINKLMLVPTAIQIAVSHPAAGRTHFPSLRHIYYGGAPMTQDLLRTAIQTFGCGFVQMYGMTETSGTITALAPEDHDAAAGARMASVGIPLPGVELKIVDRDGRPLPSGETGEILTRSVANMARYHNLPDATAATIDAEGWLHTGDAGYLDADGYLYLRDRIKDLIISGGENVYPAEVEEAIRDHPDVADVAVVGVPDPKWGEAVVAFVVPRAARDPDPDEIAAWARQRIAGYKVPKRIELTGALPRNSTGKLLRRELRGRGPQRG